MAEDTAKFSEIHGTLIRVETKLDKVIDNVSVQNSKWVASEASAKTKTKIINWVLTILGIVATSGIIEILLNHH